MHVVHNIILTIYVHNIVSIINIKLLISWYGNANGKYAYAALIS